MSVLRRAMLGQFARPRGLLGRAAGRFMAVSNAALTRQVVHALPPDADAVLEIGFGPGVGLSALAQVLPAARICGIDPSQVMATQAGRRTRAFGDRVDLRSGTAQHLPWPDQSFAAVYAVNSVQLWQPQTDGLRQALRVLHPGGRLVLGLHERAIQPDGTFIGRDYHTHLTEAIHRAGFTDVHATWRQATGGQALLAVATRPA